MEGVGSGPGAVGIPGTSGIPTSNKHAEGEIAFSIFLDLSEEVGDR